VLHIQPRRNEILNSGAQRRCIDSIIHLQFDDRFRGGICIFPAFQKSFLSTAPSAISKAGQRHLGQINGKMGTCGLGAAVVCPTDVLLLLLWAACSWPCCSFSGILAASTLWGGDLARSVFSTTSIYSI
jgi:hypothetical protein